MDRLVSKQAVGGGSSGPLSKQSVGGGSKWPLSNRWVLESRLDTLTPVSIDTWTLSTRPTLVSIGSLRHYSDTASDTESTRPTRLDTIDTSVNQHRLDTFRHRLDTSDTSDTLTLQLSSGFDGSKRPLRR